MDKNTLIQKKVNKTYVYGESPNLTIKDIDFNKRVVTGYYNSKYWIDSDLDMLINDVYVKSINERGPGQNTPRQIKHALFHDLTRLPGKIEVLKEDDFGLYFETRMSKAADGMETLVKYQEQIYTEHSIGFRYIWDKLIFAEEGDENWKKYIDKAINPEKAQEAGYFFIVKEIMLFEGSTVAFGANEKTPFTGVKSEDTPDMINKMNNKLKNLTACLKYPLKDEDLYKIELQIAQIQQNINDLSLLIQPSKKDTLSKEPSNKHTDIDLMKVAELL